MQAYRDEFAHFLKIKDKYEREGIGVEALQMAMNPQVDQYKTILSRNADATFNGYQIQSSISGKRIDRDDPVFKFLYEIYHKMTSAETTLLEVDMAEKKGEAYIATEYNVMIVITDFLGDNATISYDIYIKGTSKTGTATISEGYPEFVEEVA